MTLRCGARAIRADRAAAAVDRLGHGARRRAVCVGYGLPCAAGAEPPLAPMDAIAMLGLVPLAFASAIVRYRLMDIEVIVKRALAYTRRVRRDRLRSTRRCSTLAAGSCRWRPGRIW